MWFMMAVQTNFRDGCPDQFPIKQFPIKRTAMVLMLQQAMQG
jgi:hypothetical protein